MGSAALLLVFFISALAIGVNAAPFVKLPLTRRASMTVDRSQSITQGVPLHGNFPRDGEYFMDVIIGNQLLSLLIDTGSSDLGVSSKGCRGCTHKQHYPYDPARSPNASAIGCDWCDAHASNKTASACRTRPGVPQKQCTFRVSYEDETGFSAALWEDSFQFGTAVTSTRTVVGAMYEAAFPNPKSIDGIIGLADVGESDSGATTPLQDLVSKGHIEDTFSLCLQRDGGQMYLGEVPGTNSSATGWTPRLSNSAFYAVELTDVLIGGVSIGVSPDIYNKGGAIVDSGTSDVCLPRSAFNALKKGFSALCASVCLKGICDCTHHSPLESPIFESRCVDLTASERQAFPMVEFEFGGGLRVAHPPENYLRNGTQFCPNGGYTIAIESGGVDGSGTILGDTAMQGYVVVHDRRSARIGFQQMKGKCP